ncbi:uncharacterized protein JCM6883_001340 [Sporobolomyces salmoneus]|uniref:uncharacterized protein n=1 Tax=Sporobolomyces salmoneus TaxID=183962 RepID=UPI00317A947D
MPQSDKITFLLNWHATPYHAPVFLAQAKGYFADEGIKVAILEPNDPSDVTEIIGSGKADLGAKAMVHTLAGAAMDYPITSLGTLMDEPVTGVVYLEKGVSGQDEQGVNSDFGSLRGKRIGYVGHFGKIQIDELFQYHNLMKADGTPDYTPVRCGMQIADSILNGTIDAGIGLENVQTVELEEWCKENGRAVNDVKMLRIDELAKLGCCCFCSILLIGNDNFIAANKERVAAFMRAVKKGTDFLLASPAEAWNEYKSFKKSMRTPLNEKIFERSINYMSKDLVNVERDWNKVTGYCKRLGLLGNDFKPNYTNEFIAWEHEPQPSDPDANQKVIAAKQEVVRNGGGVLNAAATSTQISVGA